MFHTFILLTFIGKYSFVEAEKSTPSRAIFFSNRSFALRSFRSSKSTANCSERKTLLLLKNHQISVKRKGVVKFNVVKEKKNSIIASKITYLLYLSIICPY
jgi:hypothetical protein